MQHVLYYLTRYVLLLAFNVYMIFIIIKQAFLCILHHDMDLSILFRISYYE